MAKRKTTPKKLAKPAAKKPKAVKAKPRPGGKQKAAPPAVQRPLTPKELNYEAYKEQQAGISRERSAKGRDAGPPPDIADIERREACAASLKLFCETYAPEAFSMGWSDAHLRVISRIEEAATLGALFAFALPRGSGKTTISRMGALWATLNGICRYAFLIGATAQKAADSLDAIKTLIRFGPLLGADYPEVSHYARHLGGIANRASGQTCGDASTLIDWSADGIVMPTVPPPSNWPAHWPLRADGMVPTSGVVIATSGLTGDGIRGSVKVLTNGESVRPDFVLLDDPQTPESARSKTQNLVREQLVSADVLGMAGPGKAIAAVMPCTVIEPGDMADSLLSRAKHPMWRGERSGILKALPKNLTAWDAYFDVYSRCAQLEPPDFTESNAYYVAHREELEEGAEAAWDERKLSSEVSAVQHAMHLRYRDPFAFAAEYMNDPKPLHAVAASSTDAEMVAKKVAENLPRLKVPRNCTRVTAMIDVGEHVLWWCVTAWDEKFGGTVIDYGPFPDQTRIYFSKADARPTICDLAKFRDMALEAAVFGALEEVAERVCGRRYVQEETGAELMLSKCLVDANYGKLTNTVYDFCRRSTHIAMLIPSHGKYIGPKSTPINAWPKRDEREQKFDGCRVSDAESGKRGRKVVFDTNYYKSFVASRLRTPKGAAGCLTLFDAPQAEHQMFADHCAAEYPKPKAPDAGYKVDEWVNRPGRDNDFFDCLVGTAVAASLSGLKWDAGTAAGAPAVPQSQRGKRVPLSERIKAKEQARERANETRELTLGRAG